MIRKQNAEIHQAHSIKDIQRRKVIWEGRWFEKSLFSQTPFYDSQCVFFVFKKYFGCLEILFPFSISFISGLVCVPLVLKFKIVSLENGFRDLIQNLAQGLYQIIYF